MTKTWKRTVVAASLLTLGACAAQPSLTPTSTASSSEPRNGESRFGTLPPRKLAAGECAMFLWLRNAERKLVFFGNAEGIGRAVLDGKEVGMKRTGIEGREAFGQYEDQTFIHQASRVHIHVGFEKRDGMNRGVVVPQGTLRLQEDSGWEYILPVAGLVACEGE